MLGFRGASRYISEVVPRLLRAGVPCALKKVHAAEMGLTNVEIMVPFVRTLGERNRISSSCWPGTA